MKDTTKQTGKARTKKSRRPLSRIQIALIVVGSLIFAVVASFGGYLIYEEVMYQRALRNYPVAYTELIAKYSKEYELDPYWWPSFMRLRKLHDPSACSDAGALGLMRCMRTRQLGIAEELDLDAVYTQDMLKDPETNIEFGCWYLHFVSGRFHGNVKQMIAAYNAGHGSVEDWLNDPRFSANGELTTIPFEQTARYYEKVTTAYENYTTLYPDLFSESAPSPSVVAS